MNQITTGVITPFDDNVEYNKVKWALESIITNKASEGDRMPVELFKS